MIKINEQLLINSMNELNYQRDVNFSFESMLNMHNHAMNWIATSNPLRLPCLPPPEKHPYEEFFPLNLNFSKYIIGTFPPISYMTDTFANIEFCNGNKVSKPQLPFYHGNRQKLWQYLLTEDDFSELSTDRIIRRKQIIDFLIHNRINYADVISFCQRGEYNADDSNLFNIILNERLVDIFKSNLKRDILLVFNTGSLFTNKGLKFNRDGRLNPGTFVFDMFIYLIMEAGLEIYIQFQNHDRILIDSANSQLLERFKNIIRFDLFINNIRVKVVAGPSPADGDGKLHENQICKRFERIFHYNQNLSAGEIKKRFKRYVYQTALLEDADALYRLNYD